MAYLVYGSPSQGGSIWKGWKEIPESLIKQGGLEERSQI